MECSCEQWKYYTKNYVGAFDWYVNENPQHNKWYFIWTKLTESEGFTQVDRFAIPMRHCPCCGGTLKPPEE